MKVSITVKAGSKKGPLVVPDASGGFVVFVREQAVKGKANKAVIELIAKHFGVPKTFVEIANGHSSNHKTVSVQTD